MKILSRSFYNRPTLTVARQLLGKTLCRRIERPHLTSPKRRGNLPFLQGEGRKGSGRAGEAGGRGEVLRGRIIEVEAYVGPDDRASHASRGKTKRNATMFGPPGYAYVYLIYGMYWCLNIVTEREEYPAAVLIRAVEPIKRISKYRHVEISMNGPGKLCRALAITGALNGCDVTKRNELWIEDAPRIPRSHIIATSRIGVDYAGAWKKKKWRFLIATGGPS